MSWRIFVEGKEVDVPQDLSAQFTYTIDDIRDFAARNTSFSKTIVLPGTARNKGVFGHIFDIGAGNFHDSTLPNVGYNFNAAKAAKCLITHFNIPIFKGVIRILEIIIDGEHLEMETVVFGELGGLIAAIGDKKLEDIDLGTFDHIIDLDTIEASWTAPAGSGYYYPMMDYGFGATAAKWEIRNFRPAFYLREYVDRIIKAAGYTYESDFFDTDYFKRLIIPHNGELADQYITGLLNAGAFSRTVAAQTQQAITFNSVALSYFRTLDNKLFRWEREAVSARVKIKVSYGGANTKFSVVLLVNSGIAAKQDFVASQWGGSATFEATVPLNPNAMVSVDIWNTGSAPISFFSIEWTAEATPAIKVPVGHGDMLRVNALIPKNIYQRDLFKWVVQMFNLYIAEDKDRDKHLRIEPYIYYYKTDKNTFLNWDEKLDRDSPVKLKLLSDWSSRLYEFAWKKDNDYYNDLYQTKWQETYGSSRFDTGFAFAKEKTTIEVGFSPSPLVGYADRVAPAIIKVNGEEILPTGCNIRILMRSATNPPCGNWKLYYTAGGIEQGRNYGSYPYAGHLDDPDAPTQDLNWGAPRELFFDLVAGDLGNNLVNVFWAFYLAEITDKDSKLLAAQFRLDAVDIYNLDFSRLIYIAGQYWRLNKVQDYSTDQPSLTQCELLKVISII